MWEDSAYRTNTCYTCGLPTKFGTCSRCDLGETERLPKDPELVEFSRKKFEEGRLYVERVKKEALARYEASKVGAPRKRGRV